MDILYTLQPCAFWRSEHSLPQQMILLCFIEKNLLLYAHVFADLQEKAESLLKFSWALDSEI